MNPELIVHTEATAETLFNQRSAAYELQAERPEHRAMVLLKAQGFSNMEIAAKMGVSSSTVATAVKQPWAVKMILEELTKCGREEIVAMFQVAKTEVAQNMIDMATGKKENVPAAVQKAACDSVIDRLLGKATQPIDHHYSKDDLDKKVSDEELFKLAGGGRN